MKGLLKYLFLAFVFPLVALIYLMLSRNINFEDSAAVSACSARLLPNPSKPAGYMMPQEYKKLGFLNII